MQQAISIFIAPAEHHRWAGAQGQLLDAQERRHLAALGTTTPQANMARLSRVLRRRALEQVTGVAAQSWQFVADALGRPTATSSLLQAAAPAVSLSHSKTHAVVAVAHTPWLGVDTEPNDRFESDPARAIKLMHHALESHERSRIRALPESQWPEALMQQWALKEAACKAAGQGLRGPWRQVAPDVALGPLQDHEVRLSHHAVSLPGAWLSPSTAAPHVALVHMVSAPQAVVAVAFTLSAEPHFRRYTTNDTSLALNLI